MNAFPFLSTDIQQCKKKQRRQPSLLLFLVVRALDQPRNFIPQFGSCNVNLSNSDPVKLNSIDWLKLFPVLQLTKSARLGLRIRVLLPAMIVIVCLAFGPQFRSDPLGQSNDLRRSRIGRPVAALHWYESVPLAVFLPESVSTIVHRVSDVVLGSNRSLRDCSWQLSWNLLIVGVLGVAVGRAAGTAFCADSRSGGLKSLRYSFIHLIPFFGSTGLAVFIVALFVGPLNLAGWGAAQLSDGTPQVVMMCWLPLAGLAVLGLLAAVVCLSGWFLSLAAIGVDGCNGADALSRGINYTLTHKLVTFWYLFVAAVVSVLARWFVSRVLLAGTLKLQATFPAVSRFPRSGFGMNDGEANPGYSIAMFVIEQLPAAVHWGTFMSGVTIVYVLLRQREDAVNLNSYDDAVVKK